ncbi:DUF4153 domain-containing protein [uncultured Alistipes sp.]|uniref:DUF4153 domain-containing protein n=1 Tax=uncultured Alistipes sp. TaxID=538949 RepID=UPI0025E37D63|nr:DUF4153 domain-containing protein [uncultured Alistipes sp.]
MKEKLKRCLHWLWQGFLQMLRLHPVETALVVYGCVGCILSYELDTDDYMPKLALLPLFFTLALVVKTLAGNGPWRRVYWVSWTPIIPLSLWGGLEDWLSTEPAFLTFGVLAPLALVMCTRALCNDRFVSDVMLWLRSGILALFFANVALGLFGAILYSTTYIFGLHGSWIEHVWVNALILTETFATPVLFLMMADRWNGAGLTGNRILEVLLNYIVAPALLIYTGILYLYMVKILFTWSLPEGGVAYLVFGFTIFAIIVKALQFLLQKRMYDWFFDLLSLVALPTQVLFWIGVVRRTSEYGLTVPRVYLLVCGGLMTLCLLIFLSQRAGRYLYLCMTAFVVFAAFAYIPGLKPERIAVKSQAARAERVARALDRLDDQGHVMLHPVLLADTVRKKEYRKLYESLNYIQRRDTALFARFGVKLDDLAAIFPQPLQSYVKWGGSYYRGYDHESNNRLIDLVAPENAMFEADAQYTRYYTKMYRWGDRRSYVFDNDTLRLYLGQKQPLHTIAGQDIVEHQLKKSGFRINDDLAPTNEQLMQLLDYRDAQCRIFFDRIELQRTDSTTVLLDVQLSAVMLR